MKPLVSVVTPVYNEEAHLAECIESILAQSYQNWEYTILDNCSVDSSVDIARRYAATDPRIRVIQNREFLPVIRNHNAALRLISAGSKYCKLLYADDWIFPECIERTVAVGETYPSVGIIGSYGLQGSKLMWEGLPYPSSHVSGCEIGRRHFLDPVYELGSASSLLFRSDIVRRNDPFYDESTLHADIEGIIVRLKECDFGFVHQVLCFTRERSGSISSAASEYATYKGALLRILMMHGPFFMSSEEFRECSDRALDDYYNFLCVNAVFRMDPLFWKYHRTILAGVGLKFSRARLANALVLRMAKATMNPMETIDKILRRRERKSASGESFAKTSEIEAVLRQTDRNNIGSKNIAG